MMNHRSLVLARVTFALALFSLGGLALAACGSTPRSTQTTSTSTVTRPEGGGEVRSQSTETTEVAADGASTTDTTSATQSSTPAPQ